MLKYALRENLLTPEPNDYMAQVTDSQSYNLEKIIDKMIERGSTLTKADITATMQIYSETICSLLEEGFQINTPLINTSMSISGVFDGATDSFDSSRHNVNINITPGTKLKETLAKVKTQKVEAASTDPFITEVKDIVSGKVNESLTKGGILQAVGARLKFDNSDEAQGVFLVPETGSAVRCGVVAENKPARVMAMIPADITAGTYYLEIRSKMDSSGKATKNLKVGRFNKALTIMGA